MAKTPMVKKKASWTGTLKDLLQKLRDLADERKIDWKEAAKAEPPTFPKSPRGLRNTLNDVVSNLEDEGIVVDFGKHGKKGTTLTITVGDGGDDGDGHSLLSPPSNDLSEEEREKGKEKEGKVGGDSKETPSPTSRPSPQSTLEQAEPP